MRLEQLRHLLAIAEAGSLRKAAGVLSTSQPALTKSVRQLEDELQAPLLTRTPRGVVLTEYGRVVVARGRTAFIEIDRIAEELEDLRGERGGRVRFAVSPIAATALVPAALARFRKSHPDVEVTVVDGLYPKILPMIREREIDFAIGPLPEPLIGPELMVEQLFVSDVRIACRRLHPLVGVRSLAALQDGQWATTGPVSGPGSLVEAAFRRLGLAPPRSTLRFESITALLATALKEDLLFAMPINIIDHPFYSDNLCALALRERIASVPIYLLRSSLSPLPPAAEALATAMRRTRTS